MTLRAGGSNAPGPCACLYVRAETFADPFRYASPAAGGASRCQGACGGKVLSRPLTALQVGHACRMTERRAGGGGAVYLWPKVRQPLPEPGRADMPPPMVPPWGALFADGALRIPPPNMAWRDGSTAMGLLI